MLYDLMNESKQAATYYIEMVNKLNTLTSTVLNLEQTYEWLPITAPGYKAVKLAWLDITGCGTSDYPPRTGNYEIKSPTWRATYSGRLLSATGSFLPNRTNLPKSSPLLTKIQRPHPRRRLRSDRL